MTAAPRPSGDEAIYQAGARAVRDSPITPENAQFCVPRFMAGVAVLEAKTSGEEKQPAA